MGNQLTTDEKEMMTANEIIAYNRGHSDAQTSTIAQVNEYLQGKMYEDAGQDWEPPIEYLQCNDKFGLIFHPNDMDILFNRDWSLKEVCGGDKTDERFNRSTDDGYSSDDDTMLLHRTYFEFDNVDGHFTSAFDRINNENITYHGYRVVSIRGRNLFVVLPKNDRDIESILEFIQFVKTADLPVKRLGWVRKE